MRAHDWVDYHAISSAAGVALADADTGVIVTWRELERRVASLAYGLAARHGVRRGDRVLLVAENDVRTFVLQFACMRLGAILVPLNWRLAQPELEAIGRDAEPSLVVFDGRWEILGQSLAAGSTLSWRGLRPGDDWERSPDDSDGIPASTANTLDDITHVLYTSGTTGKPKGAISTHRTLQSQALSLAHENRMAEPHGHHLNVLPLFHAGGLLCFSNPMLFWGGRVTTIKRFDPERTLDLLTGYEPAFTHFCGVLQMFEQITALPRFQEMTLREMRSVLFGGWGPTTQPILKMWRQRGVPPQVSYGATELGPSITMVPPHDYEAGDAGSSGFLLPYNEIRLLDEKGRDVEEGDIGEIWVRGASVTPGYWRSGRGASFEGDWFKTGDMASRDARGHYFIAARMRDVYRSGGENVNPVEVEAALLGAPGVAELCVTSVPDEKWGEVGLVVVVPCEGATVTLAGLQEYGARRIARFKLPRRILFLDELPRNATGKVPRALLQRQFLLGLSHPQAQAQQTEEIT